MSRLLNFALFYLGWFACVGGAARGALWFGPAVVAVLVLVHLRLCSHPGRELRLILLAGLVGFVVDTLQATAGLYAFTSTSVAPWLCPPWMMALWMVFATTLNGSMAWLAGRFALGAALGAIFGPLSYLAGARLGAIELQANTPVALAFIALAWAGAMPLLLWLREVVSAPPSPRLRNHVRVV